jgi:UPF0716 family protein affecting phage T7 exclusion
MTLNQALFYLWLAFCIYHLVTVLVTKGVISFVVTLLILCASFALGHLLRKYF